MNRTHAIVLICLVVLGAVVAYTAWQPADPRAVPETERADSGAARPERQARASGDDRRGDETPGMTALAESVRPSVVTFKHGKPLWALSYEDLHEHVDDLRALAGAGWGQAVLPLVRLVSGCLGNRQPRTERDVREHARSMRANRLENRSDWPEDELQRQLAQVDDWLEYHLDHSSRRRAACAAVTAADEGRIMDWLELALEQRHPAFMAGYLRWDVLPGEDAWMFRYAERLADFNRHFEAAYLDGVYAGERAMLDLAWKLYATRKVLPESDPFKAFAFNHAAELDARDRLGTKRQYMDSYRLEAIDLNPALADDARAEGERIYERCCADARMPR